MDKVEILVNRALLMLSPELAQKVMKENYFITIIRDPDTRQKQVMIDFTQTSTSNYDEFFNRSQELFSLFERYRK